MNKLISWVQGWTGGGVYSIIIFPFVAFLLLMASLRLVKFADVIIHKTKLGSAFVGGTLIAFVTSIPELITEITQAVSGHPENGLGDDIGSNGFSAFLIAIVSLFFIRHMFLNNLSRWTKITISISFGLSILLSIYLVIGQDVSLGIIGIMPLSFFIIYIIITIITYKYGEDEPESTSEEEIKSISAKSAIWKFALWSLIVIILAVILNINISAFQRGANISSESIGGIFLGVVTSLPEIVAFIAFLRKKNATAGVASLVGSHFFNLAILFFGDLSYTGGPTFDVSAMHENLPLAIMTAAMLGLLVIMFIIQWLKPKLLKNKVAYSIIPTIIGVGYIVGWVMILLFN